MPAHDWTRVGDEVFHDFHLSWVVEIKRALKRALPSDFYTLVEPSAGDLGERIAFRLSRLQPGLVIRHTPDGRTIARIIVLTPGTKASRRMFHVFLRKTAEWLRRGIPVLVVDVHPPSLYDPKGIHAAILNEIRPEQSTLANERPLTAMSFIAEGDLEAFIADFAVGEPIPDMPLFLTATKYITVPLEATYSAAWEDVPPRYQEILRAAS
jgi:hypothetical protein